jgi:hypothetical protein
METLLDEIAQARVAKLLGGTRLVQAAQDPSQEKPQRAVPALELLISM